MKQLVAQAIVLTRTNYGEADRIVTLLTPDQGKLRLMARGVRKPKSKLAGGIELFSVSDITYLRGRGEVGTLISARLYRHYGRIVQDVDRTMLGYDLIKRLDRATEDAAETPYFELLERTLAALEEPSIPVELVQLWFSAQLLRLGGHAPNLRTDAYGVRLAAEQTYNFGLDDMVFAAAERGRFNAHHITLLRLLFSDSSPVVIARVQGLAELLKQVGALVQTMTATHIRI